MPLDDMIIIDEVEYGVSQSVAVATPDLITVEAEIINLNYPEQIIDPDLL